MDLPDYPTKEILREKIMISINEGKEGFGFIWDVNNNYHINISYINLFFNDNTEGTAGSSCNPGYS